MPGAMEIASSMSNTCSVSSQRPVQFKLDPSVETPVTLTVFVCPNLLKYVVDVSNVITREFNQPDGLARTGESFRHSRLPSCRCPESIHWALSRLCRLSLSALS